MAAGASCPVATGCLDRTAYLSLVQTRDRSVSPIPLETGWCTATLYPYCVQMIYSDVPLQGFTWEQCGGKPTREVALRTTTTTTPPPRPPPTNPPVTPTPTPTPAPAPSSSTPVGAIVGGIIGGLAVIGLIILGLFYIKRRKRDHEEPGPAPQQPEVGYAPGPDPYGGPPADFRGSMFKAPYETTSAASPPTSPTFHPPSGDVTAIKQQYTPPPGEGGAQYQAPLSSGDAGIAPVQTQYQAPVAVPAQYAPQQQQQQPGQAPVYPDQRYELPIVRGDGEVRELRG
ncbi:hypothetical protein B0T16DRAFT_456644 [Cercophora newfieldiana]|uniref:Uncharacterized protein n=1 Tax=Cercophora newfieldiana TaxID=92897 RepID=A0AA39YAV1_9PEZI|nr:hypothetical protein B0T16DRAFT_456644 [Cercophora newfieldiana]